ncbi:MAG: hypothetical protein J5759_01600 [Bacteroidales bacterium]|nr:hypothetical protein [Bacteroidales bacterium]
MRIKALVLWLALLVAGLPAAAQFYTDGCEPASVRWWQITTPDYKVLYPEGLDSLARVYADYLERVKLPAGATAGYYPNQEYRRPLPVILYPRVADANGMVAWTPRRMQLYTTPTFLAPEPTPWPVHLVTHESRHVAQMQFVNARPYKPFRWLVGDLFAGGVSTIYCGSSFYEGDAVAAETELTNVGRGREASFLEYYRAAFREGDTRNFWQWRYGSIKKFTPDYYKVGYIRAAGMRDVFGVQDFTARYYERLFRRKLWPWPMFNYQKTVREATGKRFKPAFAEITDTLKQRWQRDELARAPFMPSTRLTGQHRRFTQYKWACVLDSTLYAVRSGLTTSTELVRIAPDGSVTRLSSFAHTTSRICASEPLNRLYWSEIVADTRWEQRSYSEIWYAGPDGQHARLTEQTRWYNPSVAPDGLRLAVTEYPVEGGSALVVIDAVTGAEQQRYPAPEGVQLTESAWVDGKILAAGINDGGYTFYDVTGGFAPVFDCGYAVVKELWESGGELHFTSDLTGVDELYRLRGGSAFRLTSSPQGGAGYAIAPDSEDLLYSALDAHGRHILSTPLAELPEPVQADFTRRHAYELAPGLETPRPVNIDSTIVLADPVPYNRLAHIFRFHSWAPIYVSTDAIKDQSFEDVFSTAGLGATVFFQNELETMVGSAAYHASWPDSNDDPWTHSVETKFSYSGLYPKIEVSAEFSTERARLYFMQQSYTKWDRKLAVNSERLADKPSASLSLLMYLPLNYSSGGVYRGVIPQLRASVSNDVFVHGAVAPMNKVSASIRGYAVRATPSSCVYPRLGGGIEAGVSGRFGAMDVFAPNAYIYGYGYLPGLMDTHGIRLTATAQAPLGNAYFSERYVATLPRGMRSFNSLASKVSATPLQSCITMDYVFPFLPVDCSWLSPVVYLRNFECTLHADGAYFAGNTAVGSLMSSVGADLCAVLGNLAWLPFTTRIGVSAYYNFGAPSEYDKYHIGMVFNVDM